MTNRPQIFFAIVVMSLCWIVIAADQKPPAAALREHLKNESFSVVTSIRGLPLGVREEMQALFGSQTLDIAEPGADFQVTEWARTRTLPTRRLVAAGCSTDHCLIYYERGGRARTWRVALFLWTPTGTRFEGGVQLRIIWPSSRTFEMH